MSDHETIRGYITKRAGRDFVADDVDLFESGVVNSLFAVQIVMWLERVMRIPVRPEDLELRNFSSINAIAEFVRNRRAQVVEPSVD